MSKKKYTNETIEQLRNKIKQALDNKFFRLWISRIRFNGLDKKKSRYIMKQFWMTGTVACGKDKNIEGTEGLFFQPWAGQFYDLYDEINVFRFVNMHNMPFIPNGDIADCVDGVIGWCNSGRKSVQALCSYYIERMCEIQLTINVQLGLQNTPFMVGVTPEMQVKANDLMVKILNHEPVLFVDVDDVNLLKAVLLNTDYNIDKLVNLYYDYESQLFNILGIDNATTDSTKDRMLLDQTNANNIEINSFYADIMNCIQDFVDDINDLYGTNITIDTTIQPAASLYEENNPELEDNTNRQVGGQTDEN